VVFVDGGTKRVFRHVLPVTYDVSGLRRERDGVIAHQQSGLVEEA
jgi:hypothetical protein